MPKIRWTDLPPMLRLHLFDRVADRRIPAEDLYELKLWRESEPEAPAGPWYKDFGSFKICGEREFPQKPSFCWGKLQEGSHSRAAPSLIRTSQQDPA